jgi:hypothetical protein
LPFPANCTNFFDFFSLLQESRATPLALCEEYRYLAPRNFDKVVTFAAYPCPRNRWMPDGSVRSKKPPLTRNSLYFFHGRLALRKKCCGYCFGGRD